MAGSASLPAAPPGPNRADAVIGAVPVATGLEFPDTFTFAPDGRIFYGEHQTGEIRILDPSSGSDTLFFTVPDLSTNGEQGVLGLALHPSYPAVPALYVFATRRVEGQDTDQILVVRDEGGMGGAYRAIYSGEITGRWNHHGGVLRFGPDGRLYVVRGDAEDPANAQDPSNTSGKMLRMTARGGVPPDNPLPGSLIYAYGLRNSFGMTFDPQTGYLWETDNGPSCNDEVNRIVRARNYGWGPSETCLTPPDPPANTNQDGPGPVLPLLWYTPTIAPVGIVFCSGCALPESEGTLFFGSFNYGHIRRLVLTPDRTGVASEEIVYTHTSSILSMERAPDGAIHFSDPGGIYRLVGT